MADSLDALLTAQAGKPTGVDSIEALLTQQAQAQPAAPAAPPDPPKSMGAQLVRQAGLFGRMAASAATALPAMAGDALNSGINLGIGGINSVAGTSIPKLQMPSQMVQQGLTSIGVPEPQNTLERLVQAGGAAAGSTAPSIGLGKLLASGAAQISPAQQAIATALQAAPGTQAVSASGSGLGGQGAAELGLGPLGQLAGAVLGGGTTALAMTGAKSAINAATAPTKADMMASALRDQQQNTLPDATVKPRLKLSTDGTIAPVSTTAAAISEAPIVAPAPPPVGGKYQVQDQLANIALLKKIGLEQQRPATISGDRFASGIDYENAKLANPLGEATRAQLATEQSTLKNYANGIVQDAGAMAQTPEAVGQTIRAPMAALSEHFDNAISQVYDAAKTKAGGLGQVDPVNLNSLLANPNFRETLLSSSDGTALLGSIERQVKRFQGLPIEGEPPAPAPNTVNSAENLRKWLNSQWSPSNSRMLGDVKKALDFDVANAGGAGVFDQARKLHQLRMNTLDNPNGIAKLLTSDGPNGINQAIPDELVGAKLLAMPTGQFAHILDTIKQLPDSLQPVGQQAISEIKAEFARRIYKAGDPGGTQNGPSIWNAANVTREMNANRSKMALIFSADDLDKFSSLNNAGHIIQTPMAYKGAAAQGYNYMQKGVLTGLPAGGAGLGALLSGGNPIGAAAGGALGGVASSAAKSRMDAAMMQRLAEQLRNPMPTFPKQ